MSFHKSFASGADTSDATAEQWDIKNGKTAYIASGKVTGSGYFPAMMKFNGSTGYYSKTSVTTSGNKFTLVASIVASPVAATQVIHYGVGPSSDVPCLLAVVSSGDANNPNKVRFRVQTTGATIVCDLYSNTSVTNGDRYTIFADYDGDAGTATLRINGADEDNTGATGRVAPTTTTLDTGVGASAYVGATNSGSAPFGGQIGFCGLRFAGGLTWSDFMQTDGTPKQISEASASPQWAEWGGQPLFWHESGKMDENKGSAGAMTANGTITLAAASSWS